MDFDQLKVYGDTFISDGLVFNMYRHTSLVLTQFHLKPSSTKLYWPSTTKYQPVPPNIDPAPPNTDQNCLLLTQYYNISSNSASYWPNKHHTSTHTALYWPSTSKYQPAQPHTDPPLPITNLYCLLLTKYHNVSTSSSPHWPSTTKYEPVPPHSDPVLPSTNPYRLLLAQYHDMYKYSNVLRWAQLYVSLVSLLAAFGCGKTI